MKRLKYGLVGGGFVGPYHIEAVRRLGFVEISALAGADLDLAKRKAEQLFVPGACGALGN
jgi:predicted dehydrogenase